jgi:hypothetical protein
VDRVDQPQHPDKLIVFVSTRCDYQSALPLLGHPEGFFRAEAPFFTSRNWQASYDPQSDYPGLNSGFVSLRYSGKAIAAQFDGHADAQGWSSLNDMRRWADRATRADWRLGQP